MEFDWCIDELEKSLLLTNWVFETEEESVPNELPTNWAINKDSHQLQINFYWNVYEGEVYCGACQIHGTSISLDFFEINHKDFWLKNLRSFIEKLNKNFNLINFGGHLLEAMTFEQGIEIAQEYIDNRENMNAKIEVQTQFMSSWYTLDHPVWIVFAENLNKEGPIIDGVSTYSIVVSTITRKVEDVTLL